ncbi:DUF4336 domain-containing protein [Sandaracinus amylolyticus]|uniref:DUF4336 domain-containing protein n=1 Tax=Sandaracinus amylolyticus TaxID=927083 RepID=UPI001F253C49|nr:DUF4336 domain-containing protein [Sandaracinus amylolyticus]UJR86711.1 Hypothetical protein I5071_88120 [Sandaracinus amylolyticus]
MVDTGRALTRVTDGVWVATEPVRIVGMRLTTTMTVLALRDGSVLVHSPIPATPERRLAVEALGRVAHLYAPNTYHHMWLGEWAAAYPDACVHAPPGLAGKRPELRIGRVHGTTGDGAFHDACDELRIDGFRLEESVLVHRPSGTLVVTDLVHNVGRPEDPWTAFYAKTMGFYDRVGLSRVLRLAAFSDRRAARRSVDDVLSRSFDRLVVGHGTPVETGARDALAAACTWMT